MAVEIRLKNPPLLLGLSALVCLSLIVGVYLAQSAGAREQQTLQTSAKAAKTFAGVVDGLILSTESIAALAVVPGEAASSEQQGTITRFVPLRPLGIADPAFDPGSFAGHLEVNLIGSAYAGRKPGAEIYTSNKQLVVAIARPVGDTESSPGVLLLTVPLKQVVDRVSAAIQEEGTLSIYNGSDYASPVMGPGAATRAATGTGHIEIGFEPAESGFMISDRSLTIAIIAALSVLLLAGLAILAHRALLNQLKADVFRLNNQVRRGNAGRSSMALVELQPLADAVQKLLSQDNGPGDTASKPDTRASVSEQEESRGSAPDESIDSPQNFAATPAQQPQDIPAEIFRAYDIRGRSRLFTAPLILAIGRAIGSEARQRGCTDLVLGGDGRLSDAEFRKKLTAGLLSTGINVIDIGIVASPMLYFAAHHLQTQTAVMITGSHNPADHNGFKILIDGEFVCGDRITALRQRIEAEDFVEGKGDYSVAMIDKDYLQAIISDVVITRRLKVVVDCGNGAAGTIAEDLFEALGCEVIPLFCELDPSFPNHQPDPANPDTMASLKGEVVRLKADLGIAFDGDGDRIGVISAKGHQIAADRLLMLLARDLLAGNPGASVVFDVKCSSDMLGVIAKAGGVPLMWRSGHSWIKQKMKDIDAVLGGEFTGHICFRDRWYGFDDALYCAARLLELLSSQDLDLEGLDQSLPKMVGTPELHIRVSEKDKFELERRLIDGLHFTGAQVYKFDGLRAEFSDGWGLVRASNTTAALSCRFEGRDRDALRRIQTLFREEIGRLIPGLDIPF